MLTQKLYNNTSVVGSLLRLSLPWHRPGFLLVTYHRVLERPDPYYPDAVRLSTVEAQLRLFKRFCAVLPLEEIITRMEQGQPLPRRCVALTFDDGYRDVYTHAWPLLKRYQLPATLFVAVEAIERGFLWPDLLRHAIRQTPATRVALDSLTDYGPYTVELRNEADRLQAVRHLGSRLKQLPHSQKESVLRELVVKLLQVTPEALKIQDLMLSWEDLTALSSDGIDVGAHTVTHPVLAKLSEHDAEEEIHQSRQVLEQRLGKPVTHFCYPYGKASDFSPRIKQLVAAAGFRSACTTLPGLNRPSDNRFSLRRINAGLRVWKVLIKALG